MEAISSKRPFVTTTNITESRQIHFPDFLYPLFLKQAVFSFQSGILNVNWIAMKPQQFYKSSDGGERCFFADVFLNLEPMLGTMALTNMGTILFCSYAKRIIFEDVSI